MVLHLASVFLLHEGIPRLSREFASLCAPHRSGCDTGNVTTFFLEFLCQTASIIEPEEASHVATFDINILIWLLLFSELTVTISSIFLNFAGNPIPAV
jgi:hypothetical protein